jgi:monoamine oxidase
VAFFNGEVMSNDFDAIIIGAGAAGLTAAAALGDAGLKVVVCEARDRIGGRMFTVHDPVCNAPVEFGAEFIHGKPPETWNLLKRRKIQVREVDGDNWCVRDGKVSPCDFFSDVDKILKKMSARKRDQSFLDFLEDCCSNARNSPRIAHAKEWATGYVTGFNAADPSVVGVHWLVKGGRAEEKIEGDRAFRAPNGYSDLISIFEEETRNAGVSVQVNTVVDKVDWRDGHVEVTARRAQGIVTFSAARVLVTVPLGVLQACAEENGAIRFTPELPQQKQDAISSIAMGKVIRVTLRFRERFWENLPKGSNKSKTLSGMSFLFSRDEWFPTWWTYAPEELPLLVGWAPFHCAERLSNKNKSFVVDHALQSLNRLLGVSVSELESLLEYSYCHDWQADPFSRGAYSYGKVGGDGAEKALCTPVNSTLFFAGEATDIGGHCGTVHGAIASGQRAAAEIIRAKSSAKPKAMNSRRKNQLARVKLLLVVCRTFSFSLAWISTCSCLISRRRWL